MMGLEISVLLPIKDGEQFLDCAIGSIMQQSFKDFELLLIDDGSSDNSRTIMDRWAKKDGRIRVLCGPRRGLAAALNFGAKESRGRWLARMDQDDVSISSRLAEMHTYAESNNLDIAGSWAVTIGKNAGEVIKHPLGQSEIECALLFGSPFVHPSVLIRSSFFHRCKYDENFLYAEDYEYWTRAVVSGARVGNLNRVLLQYRRHRKQMSYVFNALQAQQRRTVQRRYYSSNHFPIRVGKCTYERIIAIREQPLTRAEFLETLQEWIFSLKVLDDTTVQCAVPFIRSFVFHGAIGGATTSVMTVRDLFRRFPGTMSNFDLSLLFMINLMVMIFPRRGGRLLLRVLGYFR